jgi:hypothetical protein
MKGALSQLPTYPYDDYDIEDDEAWNSKFKC